MNSGSAEEQRISTLSMQYSGVRDPPQHHFTATQNARLTLVSGTSSNTLALYCESWLWTRNWMSGMMIMYRRKQQFSWIDNFIEGDFWICKLVCRLLQGGSSLRRVRFLEVIEIVIEKKWQRPCKPGLVGGWRAVKHEPQCRCRLECCHTGNASLWVSDREVHLGSPWSRNGSWMAI
jgi:hypothetical protein